MEQSRHRLEAGWSSSPTALGSYATSGKVRAPAAASRTARPPHDTGTTLHALCRQEEIDESSSSHVVEFCFGVRVRPAELCGATPIAVGNGTAFDAGDAGQHGDCEGRRSDRR